MTAAGWLVSRARTGAGTCAAAGVGAPRVYCFPHAGGSSRTFLAWQPLLADAELVAVCPPGRDHRAAEPVPPIAELIDAAAAVIRADSADGRPYYLFGHSLGGLIAFEVARRLRAAPAPRHLIASGISAPSLLPSDRIRELAALDGREFARALGFFGGLPPEVMADDDLLELLLPSLTADFRMAAGYQYRPGPPLTVPVTLIAGRADPHVGAAQLEPWRLECAEPPACHRPDGGHFYFDKQPSAVTGLLRAVIEGDRDAELLI